MESLPSWLPWALGLFQFLGVVLIFFMGLFLKGMKTDLRTNTMATNNIPNVIHALDSKLTAQIHSLETKVLENYAPLPVLNRVGQRVGTLEQDVTVLKTRDEMRLQQGSSNRSKQA